MPEMSRIEKIAVGAMGGFAAVLVRYLSQDHATVARAIEANLSAAKVFSLVYDYSVLTPILIILGATVAWISDEQSRVKIFAMAVSAPALITTWAGASSDTRRAQLDQWFEPNRAFAQRIEDKAPNIAQNLQSLFARDREHIYAIHVGSFADRSKADALVRKINAEAKTLRAFTTEFTDEKGLLFQRVLVIRLMTLRDALALREQILRSGAVQYAAPLEMDGS